MEELQLILLFHKQKLEFFGILKQAVKVLYENPRFVLVSLFTSLPFFYMMIIYETFFQNTLIYALKNSDSKAYTLPIPISVSDVFTEEYYRPWLDMASFYLTALFFSELYAIFVTVALASTVYRRQRKRCLAMKEMILVAITATKWDNVCATAFYSHAITTCILLGSSLLVRTCYFIARNRLYGHFFCLSFTPGILILLKKYLELSAKWNMGIVVSILESEKGAEARERSAYFMKGSEGRGFLLILVFFVWGFGLRCLSTFFGWHRGRGIVVQVALFCVGNVVKWVVFTVYLFDCKVRVLKKKFDEDIGRGVSENVD